MRFFVSIFIVGLAGVLMAPAFLVFNQQLENVDCVIMMVGGEPGVRIHGAEQLVEQGRSEVLLIPAYNKVAFAEGSVLGEMGYVKMAPVVDKPVTFMGRKFQIFENTHLEIIGCNTKKLCRLSCLRQVH